MKKILTLILAFASLCATAAGIQIAQLSNGYYRVGNNFTNRYIIVMDNSGSLNYTAATADMAAIRLRLTLQSVISDPASVLYVEKHGSQYDIKAQNTGIHDIIGSYVNIIHNPQNPATYWAYGSQSGMTLYLYDYNGNGPKEESWLDTTNKTYPLARNWDILPIDNSGDNYFGVKPTISVGDKHYAPFYASFPFSCESEGMKVYYTTKVDETAGIIVYNEITGIVPELTPVIIECSSLDPSDNRLNIGGSATSITGNVAKGVLFEFHQYKHNNFVAYDKNSMRSLGITADGSLGVVSGDYEDVPRNTFYIPVSNVAPTEFRLMTQAEYEDAGISDILADDVPTFDVYTITGVKVKSNTDTTEDLPSGIYIINGKKVYVR